MRVRFVDTDGNAFLFIEVPDDARGAEIPLTICPACGEALVVLISAELLRLVGKESAEAICVRCSSVVGELRRPMTSEEAFAEARRRWGGAGHVEMRTRRDIITAREVRPGDFVPAERGPERTEYIVGTIGAEPERVGYGRGRSWEEAFEDAEHLGNNKQ